MGLRGDLRVCSGGSAAGFGRKEGASGWRSSGEHPGPHLHPFFSLALQPCLRFLARTFFFFFSTQFMTFFSTDSPSRRSPQTILFSSVSFCLLSSLIPPLSLSLSLSLSLINQPSLMVWCRVCRVLPAHMEVIRGRQGGTAEAPQTRDVEPLPAGIVCMFGITAY